VSEARTSQCKKKGPATDDSTPDAQLIRGSESSHRKIERQTDLGGTPRKGRIGKGEKGVQERKSKTREKEGAERTALDGGRLGEYRGMIQNELYRLGNILTGAGLGSEGEGSLVRQKGKGDFDQKRTKRVS